MDGVLRGEKTAERRETGRVSILVLMDGVLRAQEELEVLKNEAAFQSLF